MFPNILRIERVIHALTKQRRGFQIFFLLFCEFARFIVEGHHPLKHVAVFIFPLYHAPSSLINNAGSIRVRFAGNRTAVSLAKFFKALLVSWMNLAPQRKSYVADP